MVLKCICIVVHVCNTVVRVCVRRGGSNSIALLLVLQNLKVLQ